MAVDSGSVRIEISDGACTEEFPGNGPRYDSNNRATLNQGSTRRMQNFRPRTGSNKNPFLGFGFGEQLPERYSCVVPPV